MSPEAPTPERIRRLRRRLLRYYDDERRKLPWRGAEDPYRVWVSEVMLQQTRVETVLPYYRRWMERFPTLEDLADAGQEEVLQAWKGLGYYSRARNLHRAARLVRERHGGRLPSAPEALKELPGIGAYTAGAVASIAFGEVAPAVDGNARRVLCRLFDRADPSGAELRGLAATLVDPDRPGAFNQALMELGARVCTPSAPACPDCPVETLCQARARDTVGQRPAPRRRPRVREAEVAVVVPVDGGRRTVVLRRPEEGLLGGMWEFPSVELKRGTDAADAALRAAAEVGVAAGERPRLHALEPLSHAFTHLRVLYRPFLMVASELRGTGAGETGGEAARGGHDGVGAGPVRVVGLEGLDAVPLPVAQQEIGRRALEAVQGSGRTDPDRGGEAPGGDPPT